MKDSRTLFEEIDDTECSKYPELIACMRDGVLDYYDYKNVKVKIAFIVKEPFSECDEINYEPFYNCFDMMDIFFSLTNNYNQNLCKIWQKIAAMGYSLTNDSEYKEDLMRELIARGISQVAWINLSKTPWKQSDKIDKKYLERVQLWEPVVKAQLSEINPDIILYCDTWGISNLNLYEPDIPWKNEYCTNTKIYEFKDKEGIEHPICISNYRDTDKIIVKGLRPDFDDAAKWQTEFIKDFLKNNKKNYK